MLHAIANSKSMLYKRYLGERQGQAQEGKVSEEDEITSTILGPLDFLSASEVYAFWKHVLEKAGHSDKLPSSVSDMKLKLWPSRQENNGRIEPDATIEFMENKKTTLILLMEFKWRARLSGGNQLQRQWQEFLNEQEREKALHLFIAPEISAGIAARNEEDVWDGRLVFLPWIDIKAALKELITEKTPIGRWAGLVDSFLEKIGIQGFNGFSNLAHLVSSVNLHGALGLWSFNGFAGLAHIIPSQDLLKTRVSSPLFWRN
jgi:hypothetical protein